MTQVELARDKKTTPQMAAVAEAEHQDLRLIMQKVSSGHIVIPKNINHEIPRVCGIGELLRTKVNTNLGTSQEKADIGGEIEKLNVAITAGTDTVMDLSTGGNLQTVLKKILKESCVPVGTVPIYEAVADAVSRKKDIKDVGEDTFFEVMERQAHDGVDFFTVHCGVTIESVARLKQQTRILDVVSRGGAILVEWMLSNKKENPFYERFDDVLKIAKKYDVALSLGDGMRPGAIDDGTDRAQIQELIILGELAKRARDYGVGVMIEGPGHLPLDQIEMNVKLEKMLCEGAPFYVLGPLVTDIAPGYDHITGAIGGAIAASFGADFLCYVTPSEHLRLPTVDDVRLGVIASRIAAHAADIVKKVPYAARKDISMSRARKKRDWASQFALAIDPEKPKAYRKSSMPQAEDVCTMCSKLCSIKIADGHFNPKPDTKE